MRRYNQHGADIKFKHASTINHGLNSEGSVIDQVVQDLGPHDVFYDIGACHGLYSAIVQARRPSVNVVSFEPHPDNRNRMIENMDMNGLEHNIYRVALSNESGMLQFTTGKGPGVHRLSFDDSIDSVETRTEMLDDFIRYNDLPLPNVVKIDVEGAEWQVLDGMRDTLNSDELRSVYIEVHLDTDKGSSISNYEGSEADLEATLSKYGFDVAVINERQNTYHIKATK